MFARSGSKPEAGSYNSYHEESRKIKCAHNSVTVDNQVYVGIVPPPQNDSYSNILKYGTPYLEYAVCTVSKCMYPNSVGST